MLLLASGCMFFSNPPPVDSIGQVAPPRVVDTQVAEPPEDPITLVGPTIILVSIDGFAQRYWEQAQVPALKALAAAGSRAESLQPVYPSKTFPNHYSQVTGLYPEHHGIVDNSFEDPVSGEDFDFDNKDPYFWLGEPIWITAERQGLPTATMFWPGSEVSFDGDRPRNYVPYDGSIPNRKRVDQALEWLELPDGERPRFLTLYFSDVDHEGHIYGPESASVYRALEEVDESIERLVSGLEERGLLDSVDILVVSDHGMEAFSSDKVAYIDDYLDLNTVQIYAWAQHLTLDAATPDGLPQVMEQLALIPNVRCYTKEETPAYLHFSESDRIRQAVCLPDEGWVLSTHAYADDGEKYSSGATHGWDPTYPSMHGIFVAHGPHIQAGYVHPTIEQVQLYNLMAEILKVEPANNDGDPSQVADLLR